jgi:hypothetical protein
VKKPFIVKRVDKYTTAYGVYGVISGRRVGQFTWGWSSHEQQTAKQRAEKLATKMNAECALWAMENDEQNNPSK